MVTQADVEALLVHGAVIRSAFRWTKVGRTNWRAEVWLEETYEGARVKLTGTYNTKTRNLSYTLIWAGCRIRGLDVGGPAHPNPDGEWLPTPHKHRWVDGMQDRWAYTPDDIVSTTVGGILSDFLGECNITLEGAYHGIEVQESCL